MKNDLSNTDLKFILDLYKTTSLTVTAADFEVSIPTASRMLNRVREIFGDECFVRSGNIMVPTRRIRELIPQIRNAVQTLEGLTADVQYRPEAIARRFVLHMIDNAAVALLLPVLSRIHEQAPNLVIQIRATQGNPFDLLRSGEVDLSFGYPPDETFPSDIRSAKLFDSRHVCIVRKGHPLCSLRNNANEQGYRKVLPEDLRPYPVTTASLPQWIGGRDADIIVRGDIPHSGTWIDTAFIMSIPFFVMESDSYGFLPLETAEYLARFLPLEILEIESTQVRPWTPHLLWHITSSGDYELQWLRTTICQYFEEHRVPELKRKEKMSTDSSHGHRD